MAIPTKPLYAGHRFERRQHKGLNNRAENSHQPTRRRERQMKRFKLARHAERKTPHYWQISLRAERFT